MNNRLAKQSPVYNYATMFGIRLHSLIIFFLFFLIPFVVFAQELPNPIQAVPAGNPDATVIDIVFAGFAGFAGLFGVLVFGFILINAFKLIVSHGNEESITKAKQGLTWSIVAFLIAIFAFSLISAVQKVFNPPDKVVTRDELSDPEKLAPPIYDAGFLDVFQTFFTNILGLVVIAATLMIVYAGIKMVTASGNEEQITSAKTILKWAIVGIVVTGLAFAILKGLDTLFV